MKYIKITGLVLLLSWAGAAHACRCLNRYDKIDKLSDLAPYEFIALVKIGKLDTVALNDIGRNTVAWNFSIVEMFKGEEVTSIIDRPHFTSCRIGLKTGDEWLLFGKMVEGKLSIVACDRNLLYKRIDDAPQWQSTQGTSILARLRELYPPTKAAVPVPPREKKNRIHKDTVAIIDERAKLRE